MNTNQTVNTSSKSAVAQDTDLKTINIQQRIPNAPVSNASELPHRYLFAKDLSLVKSTDAGGIRLSPCPIVISECSENRSTGLHYVTLAWMRDGRWHQHQIERGVIASKTSIVGLANYNFPVTSINANGIIEYLQEYDRVNSGNIPKTFVDGRLGWTEDMAGFLWGHSYLSGTSASKLPGQAPVVRFKGADQGDEQFANGFAQKGSFAAWASIVNEALEYADVAFALYTSLAAPLLPILGVDNFTLELCAPSSSGKTTALMLAASAWGNPSFHAGSFINTWNGTDNRIGRMAALLNGLPLFLDETKLARLQNKKNKYGSDLVTDTIYMIASGMDKGRATLRGSERVQPFRTILFSTGETPSLDLSTDGGARGRIIDLWGNPFLRTDAESKAVVTRTKTGVTDHFGHAGPRMVQFILDHRDQWPLWKEAYAEANELLTKSPGLTPVEMRLGEYFAAVATAIAVIHAALPELKRSTPVRNLLDSVWSRAMNEAKSADIASQAFGCVEEWISSNQNRVYLPAEARQNIPWSGDMHGAYCDVTDDGEWTFAGLTKTILDDILRKNGFKALEVVRLWKDKGWLITDDWSKGYQRKVVIPKTAGESKNVIVPMYCFSAKSFWDGRGRTSPK